MKADNYAEYELCYQCFSRNFLKIFRTVFSKNTFGGMLLILCDCSFKISRTPFTLERKDKYISKPSSEYLPVDVSCFIEEHLKASDEATLNFPREKGGHYQKRFLFTNRFFLLSQLLIFCSFDCTFLLHEHECLSDYFNILQSQI